MTTVTKRSGRFGSGLLRVLATVTLVSLVVAAIGYLLPTEGQAEVPMGLKRNTALYVPMRDGIQIAVDVWLPEDLASGQRVPTLLYFTRYGRAQLPGLVKRSALGLGMSEVHPVVQAMNDAGFAVVLVDARGSGASGGSRRAEFAPEEVADQSEVADWAVSQAWSNGRVGAMGVSYSGTASELLLASGNPAVGAVAPLFSDFDAYTGLVRPGGVLAREFIRAWGESNRVLDSNAGCTGDSGWYCFLSQLWVRGIKPVDADPDGELLAGLLRQRSNYDIQAATADAEFADDPVADGTMRSGFPVGNLAGIERSGVPMQVWVGWLDAATVDGALVRYNSIDNPQQLIIGPFNHGGSQSADQYAPEDAAPRPGRREQYAERLEFLHKFLAGEGAEPAPSSIRYFTMGEGKWKTTDVWPPRGVEPQRWYFAANQGLSRQPPEKESFDTYRVDFSATTGPRNRWLANLSGSNAIRYEDRAAQGRKLLVYDSAPLESALEVTGTPVVTLHVRSSEPDVAFHVYFEDVAPDGTVTYVTEGILRAIHRKIPDAPPPHYPVGPYHSFARDDAAPMPVGEIAEVKIGLISTSVQIAAGHRLRIAIGGHDASVFERIPAVGDPVLDVFRGGTTLSHVDFPVKVDD